MLRGDGERKGGECRITMREDREEREEQERQDEDSSEKREIEKK